MYKVKAVFRDKTNLNRFFKVGEEFSPTDEKRVADLLERGLIEETEPEDKDTEETEPETKKKAAKQK